MTALVAIETVVLVLLAVAVTGLLRSHGEILRRLHALGAGLDPDAEAEDAPVVLRPRGDRSHDGTAFAGATDLSGAGLYDDAVSLPVLGVEHRTLLAFLSSGCLTCRGFWDAFARPATLGLPDDVRLVVVTKDAAEESLPVLRDLAARDLAVVMSSTAWDSYAVPGSPYFTLVDGIAGRVVGEGTGASWSQVQSLLAHAAGDEQEHSRSWINGAAATEARIDRELREQGIHPGDSRLYGTVDHLAPDAPPRDCTDVRLRRAAGMSRIAAHGVGLEIPHGWEGRIMRRATVHAAESSRAVMHLASFPLPEERGDFGVGVTELMRSGDVFVTLFEYGPESLGTPLFAAHGVPSLTIDQFSPQRLQRTLRGQIGCQLFFTASHRAFCLYVVVAGRLHLRPVLKQLNAMLQALELG